MKTRSLNKAQIGFWGICLVVTAWLVATAVFEVRMGIPANSMQWVKRLVGWGIEFWLARALFVGARRHVSTAG